MNKFILILILILCPAIAGATNFDACVEEAKKSHNDTSDQVSVQGYTSYKCEGVTAEKLTARPDECAGGVKPAIRSFIRKSRQLNDGFYSSLSWSAGRCSGSCETRSFDTKDTNYLCEVRVYIDDRKHDDDVTREARRDEAGRDETKPNETRPVEIRRDGGGSSETKPAEKSRAPASSGAESRRSSSEIRHRRRVSHHASRPWLPPRYDQPYYYYGPGWNAPPPVDRYWQAPSCSCY